MFAFKKINYNGANANAGLLRYNQCLNIYFVWNISKQIYNITGVIMCL